ncbi:MAG: Cof-type HAD-IIB family hydrolase [Clostridia bacterium]
MEGIRAVFFDIDGTLIGRGMPNIPPRARSAMRAAQARGVKMCLCTGRTPDELAQFEAYPFDAFAVMNGQYCYTPDKTLRLHALAKRDVRTLVELLETEDFACGFVELHRAYVNRVTEHVTRMFAGSHLPVPPVGDPRDALVADVYQVNLFTTPEHEAQILHRLPGCEAKRWCPTYADVIARGGGKGHGVRAILAHFGISPEQALSVGDGENDIDMFHVTAHSAAMGNAAEIVRTSATYVTARYDQDGIVQALSHFGL